MKEHACLSRNCSVGASALQAYFSGKASSSGFAAKVGEADE
jgi:hypothetical protein